MAIVGFIPYSTYYLITPTPIAADSFMRTLVELLEQLGSKKDELYAIEICQELLRYCSEGRDFLSNMPGAGWPKGELDRIVESIIQSCQIEHDPVDASDGARLIDAIYKVYDTRPFKELPSATEMYVAVAYAIAIALDRLYGEQWVSQLIALHGSEVFEVKVDEVVPRTLPYLEKLARRLYGSARLTPTFSTKTGIALRPERICLLESNEFHLTFDARLRCHQFETKTFMVPSQGQVDQNAIETIHSPWPRLATGLLNLWEELDWERGKNRHGHDVIRNVCPNKADGANCHCGAGKDARVVQKARCLELFRLCNQHEIDVLVLPELCFDAALQDEMVELATKSEIGRYPSILVLGSSHRCVQQKDQCNQQNKLKMVVRHANAPADVVEHYKYNPLTDFKDEDINRHEQLDNIDKRITVVSGRHFSIVPLICKDFLHGNISEIWSVTLPTLILVPALSAVSGPFFDAARAAAVARVATVVADNGFDPESVKAGDSSKKFAIFGLSGVDKTGQTGVVCDSAFDTVPLLPVLYCLTWDAEDPTEGGGGEAPPCRVRALPASAATDGLA